MSALTPFEQVEQLAGQMAGSSDPQDRGEAGSLGRPEEIAPEVQEGLQEPETGHTSALRSLGLDQWRRVLAGEDRA